MGIRNRPARNSWRLFLLTALVLWLPAHQPLAEQARALPTTSVILWYRNYDSPAIKALLDLALRKTPEYGPYRIVRSSDMNQGRVLKELQNGNSSVVQLANVASSPEREDALLAIPIPIDAGLLGYRVCVTTRKMLERFKGINRLADVRERNIRFGQGRHWPDTRILRANGLDVVTHPRFETLFDMLEAGRFECFARGVSEVAFDLELKNNPDLVVEPDLLFSYIMPSYFFAAKHDHVLAMRVQLGLERAIMDGSFAVYLDTFYAKPIEDLSLSSRTVLHLGNPWLPAEPGELGDEVMQQMRMRIQLGQ